MRTPRPSASRRHHGETHTADFAQRTPIALSRGKCLSPTPFHGVRVVVRRILFDKNSMKTDSTTVSRRPRRVQSRSAAAAVCWSRPLSVASTARADVHPFPTRPLGQRPLKPNVRHGNPRLGAINLDRLVGTRRYVPKTVTTSATHRTRCTVFAHCSFVVNFFHSPWLIFILVLYSCPRSSEKTDCTRLTSYVYLVNRICSLDILS